MQQKVERPKGMASCLHVHFCYYVDETLSSGVKGPSPPWSVLATEELIVSPSFIVLPASNLWLKKDDVYCAALFLSSFRASLMLGGINLASKSVTEFADLLQ